MNRPAIFCVAAAVCSCVVNDSPCAVAVGSPPHETVSPAPQRTMNARSIFSTPHEWLEGRRIYFPLPKGWRATPIPPDNKNWPDNWWIKHWEKEGIGWRFTRTDDPTAKNAPTFTFLISLAPETHSDTYRRGLTFDFVGRHGLSGFRETLNLDESGKSEVEYIVLKTRYSNPSHVYLILYTEYDAVQKNRILPVLRSLAAQAEIR